MHEVGEVGVAIEKVVGRWPKTGRGGQLELEIRDATRLEAESVALDAAYYLVDHGFGSTTFTITTNDVHCTQCGELAVHGWTEGSGVRLDDALRRLGRTGRRPLRPR